MNVISRRLTRRGRHDIGGETFACDLIGAVLPVRWVFEELFAMGQHTDL